MHKTLLQLKKISRDTSLLKKQTQKYFGQPFPQFEVKEKNEEVFSNADISNKITFINFWFESCLPCVAEMEGLNQMYEKLKENLGFVFLSFTFESKSAIDRFVFKNNIRYKVLQVTKDECTRLSFKNGYPASFILDKQGLVRYSKFGGPIEKEIATQVVLTEIYPAILSLL